MHRTIKRTPVNEQEFKYEVRISSIQCPAIGIESKMAQIGLLSTLATTPGLLNCGNNEFQKLTIAHDGQQWVAVLEAVGP